MPKEKIEELKKPVMIEEEIEKSEKEAEKNKLDQITTFAKVKGGRYIINEAERQIIEIELETERDITHDLIDVGSSFSIYPQNSDADVDLILT